MFVCLLVCLFICFFVHLELDVASTRVGAPGAEDLQGYVAVAIGDLKPAEEILTTSIIIMTRLTQKNNNDTKMRRRSDLGLMQVQHWLTNPMVLPGGA